MTDNFASAGKGNQETTPTEKPLGKCDFNKNQKWSNQSAPQNLLVGPKSISIDLIKCQHCFTWLSVQDVFPSFSACFCLI